MCHINGHESHARLWDFQAFPTPIFPSLLYLRPHPRGSTIPGHPSTSTALEMALIKRQTVSYEIFDDQSPTLWNAFVGNWTRYSEEGFNNNTVTATPTPGASLSFTFSGTWVVGV